MDPGDFRDHCVWQEGESWYQLIGGKIDGVGGAALLYRSRDLIEWEYLHPLCVGDQAETGTIWECPDFFPLGDKHVLLISPIPLRKTLYMVGTYADHRFTPERSRGCGCRRPLLCAAEHARCAGPAADLGLGVGRSR